MRLLAATALLVAVLAAAAGPASAAAPRLRAGAAQADITPRTGYPFGGWTRADRLGLGQHTRLYASALVLKLGSRKVALVAVDLFAAPGGMVKAAAELNGDRGFSEQNVLVSASHTHAGPGGFANYDDLNTFAPSIETVTDPNSYVELFAPLPADRQLYTFLVTQIARAIRRADDNLAPAAAAWGSAELLGVTRNRSLEAHLANHGVIREPYQGKVEEDPQGYPHTIDPEVNVLRVDQLVRRRGKKKRRRVPIGAFSTFSNHGTVNPATYQVYNRDHHGPAALVFEARVRKARRVPRRRPVVNVFGNSNEGDQSAGLDQTGPAHAELVGRREADAMFAAWRAAGRHMTRRPLLDVRWTRVCFCGQDTATGPVSSESSIGQPFFTGSEEGRGPLYDVTQTHFEGQRNPIETDPSQGHKRIIVSPSPEDFPHAVPLLAVRIGGRMIITFPGEATAEVGRRARAAVLSAVAAAGVSGVVVSGLANEFVLYFTTPEEYDRQHYEGGQSVFGPNSGTFLQEQLVDLAQRLVSGQPAPEPYAFDPENGVFPDGEPYGDGAESGTISGQPMAGYERLAHAELAWEGGPNGLDRPVDRAFVTVQRYVRGRKVRGKRRRARWRAVTSDLGLQIVWRADDQGHYSADWEIPVNAKLGRHRFVITAKRYRLVSNEFRVGAAASLALRQVRRPDGRLAVQLLYPPAVPLKDFTWRPRVARTVAVGARATTIRPGSLRDRFGNKNAASLSVVAP